MLGERTRSVKWGRDPWRRRRVDSGAAEAGNDSNSCGIQIKTALTCTDNSLLPRITASHKQLLGCLFCLGSHKLFRLVSECRRFCNGRTPSPRGNGVTYFSRTCLRKKPNCATNCLSCINTRYFVRSVPFETWIYFY